jgi:nicotinamide/nicotinate riboside kinase
MVNVAMRVIFIGLSGPSGSGKTTLAHLLRHIFPNVVYILHADDFSKEFDQIPLVDGYLDCDGPIAVDFVRMAEVLGYMREHNGIPPSAFSSWQDSGLDFSTMQIVLVDGFLLYYDPTIRSKLDTRLFFRLSHAVAKERRFTRQGYGPSTKPDEFWKTEDYFEKGVWRNYVAAHARYFQDGDVEGEVDEKECRAAGILVKPGLNCAVDDNLEWATREIIQQLKTV